MITLTPNAISKVKEFFSTETEAKGKSLRVGVEASGCSGYQYVFAFDTKREGDAEAGFDGFAVLMDSQSAQFLKGATVDYVDDGVQQGFRIANPNVKSSCGCGNSHSF